MIDLQDKTAIVTGASRGIGAAVAYELSERGANVVLCARSNENLNKHVNEIRTRGGKAIAVTSDVSDYKNWQLIVKRCLAEFPSLDILVNNAGVIDPISLLADSDIELWSKAVDINFKGVYYGLRATLPVMQKQGSGVVVNMSSGAANSALEGWSHYCSTKAAAKKLTECAHKEYSESGIRVLGLSPGSVATDMMRKIKQSGINPVSELDWSKHISPEWVAKAVAFLCGPDGAKYSGTDFSIKTDEGRREVGLIE